MSLDKVVAVTGASSGIMVLLITLLMLLMPSKYKRWHKQP